MINLFKKLNYAIEKRKYIRYLKENPEDAETRIGLLAWHLEYGHYTQAFEQYKMIKGKYSEGSRLEEFLKAKEILKSKGYKT